MRKMLLYTIVCLGLSSTVFGADPFVGTWKLNLNKSKPPATQPGKAIKDETVVARESGDEIEVTFNGTREDGSPISIKYIVSKDAGPIKYLEGGPSEGTMVNTKKINDHTMDFTTAREGKQVLAQHAVVSADGKTLRVTVKGLNIDGQPM